jgi:hypothetical protein
MRYRLKEERLAKKNKALPETVDPIFVDEDSKEFPRPAVKFLNEKGEFEVGRIAKAEKAKLPKDAIEIVEQLLLWMPTDQRLMWLLGEVSNASIMDCTKENERNRMLRSTYKIFQTVTPLENPPSFAPMAKIRLDALTPIVEKLKDENVIDESQVPKDREPNGTTAWPLDWWRTVIVGFITGLAVGMFSIWQLQEIRRRRQLQR